MIQSWTMSLIYSVVSLWMTRSTRAIMKWWCLTQILTNWWVTVGLSKCLVWFI
jgi:hypothetical protein